MQNSAAKVNREVCSFPPVVRYAFQELFPSLYGLSCSALRNSLLFLDLYLPDLRNKIRPSERPSKLLGSYVSSTPSELSPQCFDIALRASGLETEAKEKFVKRSTRSEFC
ncbi:predicted protein [Sclerotinia sclerotiorum 1980 UF-70]|uniref:Uncharacterized protein n=1 Tax=Sclerotinia sclerotiorum (strain ATCC 18683 / 1980 / Ss-1) TaxID=665079 RepID=A7E4C0_SCLS1|nr:predicted protein [Sclerotinia sclerotiorum 1980 UF-70]EDN90742.1 predicted protein [Sclerotinia sclerotiorum 1980 UF-70]